MLRWRLEIEEFGPELHYVKGENNVIADTLSRLPRADDSDAQQQEPLVAVAVMDLTTLSTVDLREIARCQKRDGTATLKSATAKEINGVELQVDSNTGRIITPSSLQTPIIAAYHEWLIHPGVAAMLKTMQNTLTWTGMARDVVKYVRSCLICTKNKHPTVKHGKLSEKTVVTRPWFEVAIDPIGPYGKQKLSAVTMIDTTTRLAEMQAVADAFSDETSYLFDRLWLCRYPRPGRVMYDQGTEFKKEFVELLESYGIAAVPTTTRNPQANSIIERLHRVIRDKMRAQEIVTHDDWENFLHNATFALRAVHSMLSVSPAQATFGRDMIFSVEHTTDWHAQHARNIEQVRKNNLRENAGRRA
ncbi:Pol protein [Phytophthora palmivora]|uniref:Pol protein n=1 Tax=Phytophthora palmivora TaxID=4796 RepID=A0A2P4YMY4_9STRA|nr:Pol protein [Phytophthora palmivora]